MQNSPTSKPAHSDYDLVVLGSGPGGQKAAIAAAKLGKRVLVIEKTKLGGSCLHTGTIPSKSLREAALRVHEASSLAAISRQTREVISEECDIISHQLRRNHVEVVQGIGRFVSPNEIEIVADHSAVHRVSAKFILIAVGTRPRRPSDWEFDDRTVFDSDTVLTLEEHPESMLVLGAGVIGCEYASIYAKMGIEVTLVDKRPTLLPSIDQEIVAALLMQFKKYRIRLQLGWEYANVRKVAKRASTKRPGVRVCLHPAGQGAESEGALDIEFDTVLYCAGRVGNFEALQLDRAGLVADERGLIKVNTNYQTTVSHIYAVGDIIGSPALAASAAEQGRLASLHAFLKRQVAFPATFPYGIYTIPEISSVGAQEEELRAAGVEFVTGIAHYHELARGKIIDDSNGFLKLLVEKKTEKILGVHVIGTGATELVHIGQTAMAFGASVGFFVDNVFNYPTLAEAYKVAAYNAVNKLHQHR
ncbi:MAG: Si-specific NAD(P)(+) transhydrogenase [Bdellovibrionaceae bacterium]|nr:Si-specific NAD(P)(+) transhydrogenase [Pseudobdellovibrionaceae bacterium]